MIDPKNVVKFHQTQLKRCRINLEGAKDRRDYRAVTNIQRKIDTYEYTIKVMQNLLWDTYK